jgi:two-component system response regulator MprA
VHVLVVDDDEAVRRALMHALRRDGYSVAEAADGGAALERTAAGRYQAIVLDVLMPEPNGLEVCRILRERGDETPILMLTARDLVADRVAGLDAGADDYLAKPFALEELRARLRAERILTLTRTEYAVLELFLRNPRRVLSRTAIFEAVWGYDFGPGSNSLWVYISYLRAKLEAGGEPRLVQTVRGLGYVLREEP